MKKAFILLVFAAIVACAPKANAQYDLSAAPSTANVIIGKIVPLHTQNIQLIPGSVKKQNGANIYLLQDKKDPTVFYVSISLDDSLFQQITSKGSDVFTAQALEVDKAQTEIILRDYRTKLDAQIEEMAKKVKDLQVKPDHEKKADKNQRKLDLKEAMIDMAKLKKHKEEMINEFKRMINLQCQSTRLYRIFHWENLKA
jgi:hypothetical protein